MEINRHNYEHYFLLYTDNELSVLERGIVDAFVKANPDLEEELLMLQQSIVKPDVEVFFDKASLLRTAGLQADLQEQMLLHLDDELPFADNVSLEAQIATDKNLQQEWDLLRQTKLPADPVVYHDKHLLYKRQGGRLVGFSWQRVSIAAAVVGLLAFGAQQLLKQNAGSDTRLPMAKTGGIAPVIARDTPAGPLDDTAILAPVIRSAPVPKESNPAISAQLGPVNPAGNERRENGRENSIAATTVNKQQKHAASQNQQAGDIAKKSEKESNKINTPYVPPTKQPDTHVVIAKKEADASIIEQGPVPNEYATTASFTTSEENDNRVLFLQEETIRKSKLGGVFKKVKRVFERNTNINSGGNNLKIANLEFAIQ